MNVVVPFMQHSMIASAPMETLLLRSILYVPAFPTRPASLFSLANFPVVVQRSPLLHIPIDWPPPLSDINAKLVQLQLWCPAG